MKAILKPIDILLVGVGGQGTILATRILSWAAQKAGYDIKVSEIHGMAQRGGAVVTQVRLGEHVDSPLIPERKADILLAFEKLEALRWMHLVKPEGTIIVNDQEIEPLPVLVGAEKYPEGIMDYLRANMKNVLVVDALDKAIQCGNAKAANVVMTGALAGCLGINLEKWQEALERRIPRFLDVNRKAFMAGFEFNNLNH